MYRGYTAVRLSPVIEAVGVTRMPRSQGLNQPPHRPGDKMVLLQPRVDEEASST